MTEKKQLKHSLQQQKLFFVLCDQLKLDKTEAIERAKKRYNVKEFADITTAQLTELINILNARQHKETPSLSLSRPLRFRAWDRDNNRMLYEEDFVEDNYWVMDFNGQVFEMSIHGSSEVKGIDMMQSTDRRDYFGKEIFHYDIFIDRKKVKWMVDWSEKDLAWIACSFDDNATKLLSTFSATKVVGNIYEGVDEVKE